MFARLTTLVSVASIAVLAVATPYEKRGGAPTPTTVTVTATPTPSGTSCSTGSIQCCQTVGDASDPTFSLILGLLGIVVDGVNVLLGLDCSPISVIGVGGGSCDANAVCCENNNVGGLISIGCVPVIL
ncbi:fungal hydrophobin-domain-containing protein [Trametes punicea]|nr:fungal hydrophobin-domain-containing protein [Trametes punicea]